MSTPRYPHYSGESKWQPKISEIIQNRQYEPYIASDELIEAVNLAIRLKRPLLLEGEPGCGKTRLADALAYEFTQKYLKDRGEFWSYHIWNVKSVGRARDGLYTFDAVLRLRDAQMMGTNFKQLKQLDPEESQNIKERLANKSKYVTFGAFGRAILSDKDYPSILLIDEIDKADSDFPNDLLSELDRMGFEVPEAGLPFNRAKKEPIIIITSNRERPLPEPFLRRCLYYYVKFPDDRLLNQIVECRFGDRLPGKDALLKQALDKFKAIRQLLDGKPGSKPPGTSEILEFLEVLLDLPAERSAEIIEKLARQSPYLGILLKTEADQKFYRQQEGIDDHKLSPTATAGSV